MWYVVYQLGRTRKIQIELITNKVDTLDERTRWLKLVDLVAVAGKRRKVKFYKLLKR